MRRHATIDSERRTNRSCSNTCMLMPLGIRIPRPSRNRIRRNSRIPRVKPRSAAYQSEALPELYGVHRARQSVVEDVAVHRVPDAVETVGERGRPCRITGSRGIEGRDVVRSLRENLIDVGVFAVRVRQNHPNLLDRHRVERQDVFVRGGLGRMLVVDADILPGRAVGYAS